MPHAGDPSTVGATGTEPKDHPTTLLVEEAGGTVTDADGTPYTPLTRQIIAAGACHGDLRTLVDTVGGARLDDED